MDLRSLNPRDTLRTLAYPLLAFAATLTVYVLTLCPTVYVGDSGEFITNAATLGITHPTGYPLYTILTRLFVLIFPFWSAAYAVNFFSALCASLTVVCVYFILQLLTARKEIAFAIALLYGFSYTLWSRATSAEVYTLNAFFVSLAILFLFRWYFLQKTLDLIFLAFLIGVGLSQHVTGALVTLSIALLIVLKRPRILLNWKLLLLLLGIGVVGFSVYLYLPLRSFSDPPIDWGNPESLRFIVGHFFPKTTQSLFGEISGGYDERIQWVLTQAFTKEFWYFGALAVFGFIALWRDWRLVVFFLTAIGINSYFTIIRKLPLHADFDAYFLPSYMMMAILLCAAFDWLWKILSTLMKENNGRLARVAFPALVLLLPLTLLQQNYSESDRSNNWFGYDFGMNILSRVPQNAILFTVGDEQTFISWYFKYVEKKRQDIIIIDRNLLGAIWGGSHMYNRELRLPIREQDPPDRLAQQIIVQTIEKRPIYVTPRLPWDFMSKDYDLWHDGMAIQLLQKGTPKPHYRPTEFTLHPDWEKQYFDERCKLMVKFYYKEYIDNAKFWYNQRNNEAVLTELQNFDAFPYPRDADDHAVVLLLRGQLSMDQHEYARAMEAVDSAAVYAPADWRVYEMKGNISFLMKDTASAIQNWKFSLAHNANNQKLQRNIETLTKKQRARPSSSTPRVFRRTLPPAVQFPPKK